MATRVQATEFSEREWQVRCDLAACYRLFVRFGWTDLIYTHCSARHPENEGWYLINPYGLLFDEITASSLIVVDLEGNVVLGDHSFNAAGHEIHSAVMAGRTDANVVLHSHTRAGIAASCMEEGLLPLTQNILPYQGRVSYNRFDWLTSPAACEQMVKDLGANNILVMHNHGLLVCAPTMPEAFSTLYHVEHACVVQMDVMATGREPVIPEQSVIDQGAAFLDDEYWNSYSRNVEWAALLRWLDRNDPTYKT